VKDNLFLIYYQSHQLVGTLTKLLGNFSEIDSLVKVVTSQMDQTESRLEQFKLAGPELNLLEGQIEQVQVIEQ